VLGGWLTDKTDRRYSKEESTIKKSMENLMGFAASLKASTLLTLDSVIDGVQKKG
jgi:hypothetical protein